MSPITQRIILFGIMLIEYAMLRDPAPVSRELQELTAALKTSGDNLRDATKAAS